VAEGLKINILGPLATCVLQYGWSKFELFWNVGTARPLHVLDTKKYLLPFIFPTIAYKTERLANF
jgi:hypothetical protein